MNNPAIDTAHLRNMAIAVECCAISPETAGKLLHEAADTIDALKKDAERYRWLKANHLQTGADSWIRTGDDLEEAIDAALIEGIAVPTPGKS